MCHSGSQWWLVLRLPHGAFLDASRHVVLCISTRDTELVYKNSPIGHLPSSELTLWYSSCPAVSLADQGFFGCRHFSQTNKLLVQSGQPPIDWQIDNV